VIDDVHCTIHRLVGPLGRRDPAARRGRGGTCLARRRLDHGGQLRGSLARRVRFALTDVPLTEFELDQLKLAQIPLFYCGVVVVVVNLPGVRDGELRLSDRAVSGIFAGEITRWRDPEVLRSNEGITVPDLPISVVHRADTSGTSFIVTGFLSGASEDWAKRFGLGSRLAWPTGQGAKGSAGLAAAVRGRAGAIGYLEYGNARQEGLAAAQLASGQGDFVRAGPEAFKRALRARTGDRSSRPRLHCSSGPRPDPRVVPGGGLAGFPPTNQIRVRTHRRG